MSRPPLLASSSEQANLAVLDGWSLVHLGWGVGAGAARLSPWVFLGATAVYEVLEYLHEHPRGSRIFGSKRPESPANMIADVGIAALGYSVARYVRGEP